MLKRISGDVLTLTVALGLLGLLFGNQVQVLEAQGTILRIPEALSTNNILVLALVVILIFRLITHKVGVCRAIYLVGFLAGAVLGFFF